MTDCFRNSFSNGGSCIEKEQGICYIEAEACIQLQENKMMTIDHDTLARVAGGNSTQFADGVPVCPICGAMGSRLKVVEQTSAYTAYQCEVCRQYSTAETPEKAVPITSCPICGAAGEALEAVEDYGHSVRLRCRICGHETESVK